MAGKAYTVSLNVIGDATKAKSELQAVGDHAEKSSGRLSKTFGSVLTGLSKAGGGALEPLVQGFEHVQGAMDHISEHGAKFGSVLTGIGTAAMGAGAMLTGMGDKDKIAQQQLQASVEATGKSYDDFKDRLESAAKTGEKYGHTTAETTSALRILTQATGDPEKAIKFLSTTMDLSAAKHIDLSAAATQLGKSFNGSTKLLKEFHLEAGPKLKTALADAANATKAAEAAEAARIVTLQKYQDLVTIQHGKAKLTAADQIALRKAEEANTAAADKVFEANKRVATTTDTVSKAQGTQGTTMDQVAGKLKGQADAAANSFTGRLKAMKAEIEDGAAKLGQKYGPAITAAGAGMTVLGQGANMASGILGKFKTAQELGTVATEAATVAEGESAVAETAALWPILLIIAAIALLALGAYELVTHWKTVWNWVKQAVHDSIDTVMGIIGGVVDWIKSHWQLLLAILTGPFGLAVLFIKNHFNDIIAFIKGVPGEIAHVGEAIGKGIANGWIWGINAMIGAWNWMVGLLKIPGFDTGIPGFPKFGGIDLGSGLKIGKVPYLDSGGIVTSPTLAALAMNSRPEVIAPLSAFPQMLASISGGSGGSATPAGAGGGGISGDIIMEVDGREIGRISRAEALRGPGRNAVRIGLT